MKLIPTPKHHPISVRFARVFALNFAITLALLALCGYPHNVVTLTQ